MHRVLMAGNFVAPCAAAAWLMVCAAYAGDAERVSPYEAKVVAPGAPILSGPGPAFYAVDTLAEGDVVEIHREQSGGWLGIRPPEGSLWTADASSSSPSTRCNGFTITSSASSH